MSASRRSTRPINPAARVVALDAIQARMIDGRAFSQGELHDVGTAACGDGHAAYRATIAALARAKRDGDIRLMGFGRTSVWRLAHAPPEQSAAGHPVAVDGGKQAPQRSETERSTNNPAALNRSGEP